MLTALRIGNFKAFADPQRVPIRPLTFLYGANSAGKSSIIHGLVLARHALDTGELDVHRTVVGGESVDLGGFRQFVHRREVGRRMEWSAEIDVASLTGRVAELLAPVRRAAVTVAIGIALDDQGRRLAASGTRRPGRARWPGAPPPPARRRRPAPGGAEVAELDWHSAPRLSA